MEWETIETTTTQYSSGNWQLVRLRQMRVLSLTLWQVDRELHRDEIVSVSSWEFTDRGDAMVKYREVR